MRVTLYTHKELYELAKVIIRRSTGVSYPFAKASLHRAFSVLASTFGAHASAQIIRLISGTVLEGLTKNLLDRRGLEDGVIREGKAAARGQGKFYPLVSPAGSDLTILAGSVVVRPATSTQSKISYKLEGTATIPSGGTESNTVSIVALEKGTFGNGISSGTLLDLEYPVSGVSHFQLSSDTGGGLDRQTDSEYKTSIRDARKTFGEGSWAGLEALLKTVKLDSGARVIVARVYEDFINDVVRAYIDDGSGDSSIIGPVDSTTYAHGGMPSATYWEHTASGREIYVNLPYSHLPGWNAGLTEDIRYYDASTSTWSILTYNTDYFVNENTGIVALASPMDVGDKIRVWFRFYTALINAAASFVNGVPGSTTKKGWRGVGRDVIIRAPDNVLKPSISATIEFSSGYDSTYGRSLAAANVLAYLNGLNIGEGANFNRINAIIHQVPGVYKVTNLLVAGGVVDVPPTSTYGVVRGDLSTINL